MFVYSLDDIVYHVKDHPNKFNCIIKDLQGVVVKIEDHDQDLIFLCSLPNSYENVIDTMIYGRTKTNVFVV